MRDILFLLFAIMTVFTCAFMAVAFFCSEIFYVQISDVHGYICVLIALVIWVVGVLVMSLGFGCLYMDHEKPQE